MGNFNRDNGYGGGRSFNRGGFRGRGSDTRRFGGRSSGRSSFGDRQMYEAICDNCGNKCMIPFQPKSGKPVYCSKCFEDRNQRGDGNTQQTQQYKEQFEAINAKLDKILAILMPATSIIPVEKGQEEKIVEKVESPEPEKQATKAEKKKKIVKKSTSSIEKE